MSDKQLKGFLIGVAVVVVGGVILHMLFNE
jgi:uncharacterized protein YjeT (DUF2065 family)